MYGVVLWSDEKKQQALIWCEDHGNLALFNQMHCHASECPVLDAGDLVTFEVEEAQDFRRASKVKLVAPDKYPHLADKLRQAGQSDPEQLPSAVPPIGKSNVVAFRPVAHQSAAKHAMELGRSINQRP